MTTIKLKKGYNLNLTGGVTDTTVVALPEPSVVAVIPDDYTGMVPRLDKREGDSVLAGEAIFHDKTHESVKVTSPMSGVIKEVRRGERRKIEAIVIEADGKKQSAEIPTNDVKEALLQSGLWAAMRQRPYDVVPDPEATVRDIFVTCFDSAPLAPSLTAMVSLDNVKKGVEALSKITSGSIYLGCSPDEVIEVPGAETVVFQGPHPAGNAGVQAANVKPVNKGETILTLDVVTLAKVGELFATGKVNYDAVVAVTGSGVKSPKIVKTIAGAPLKSVLADNLSIEAGEARIICGNVLTGVASCTEGYLQAPYRQVTVIPENSCRDEFMGWASLSPKRFSIYHTFTSWLLGNKKAVNFDARLKGGERAIVMAGEYDDMLPMDIYAEFLIKAVIAFDIDKMEALGIYEVAPEDFALAEYADTSKIELQSILRDGLNRLRAEMS
mgnify:FL=1